jgi:hypothetical protein
LRLAASLGLPALSWVALKSFFLIGATVDV